jgi:hypothetical protein
MAMTRLVDTKPSPDWTANPSGREGGEEGGGVVMVLYDRSQRCWDVDG